jgi:solute carrier family 34 (sodium-dependent phosphate cotransporter)
VTAREPALPAVTHEHAAPAKRSAVGRALHIPLRAFFAVAGILVFILALQVIKAGAKDLVPILDNLSVSGPLNALGFGWLFAYIVLSGSPVAAIGISLLAGGTFTESEAFAIVGGSRLGASFIVLAVGFLLYMRGKRNADGLSIGVTALLTTFTTQGPAIIVGLVILHFGWLDGVSFDTPTKLLDVIDRVYGPPVDFLKDVLPGSLVFVAGVGILIGSFTLFDRALPQLESEAEGIQKSLKFLHRRPLMFFMGCAITMITLSVSISITVLVPLALKGYIKREHIIPYVMGANITTFVDTLFASVLLGGSVAFTVVLTEMVSVALISIVLLVGFYGPYSRAILASTAVATSRPRNLGVFLGAIVAVPLVLLFL